MWLGLTATLYVYMYVPGMTQQSSDSKIIIADYFQLNQVNRQLS